MEAKTQSTWQTIISSDEYKEAEKTGKIVNFVTYKDNEKVDDHANYFLTEMNDKNFVFLDDTYGISIKINNTDILDVSSPNMRGYPIKVDFPLFCFENENVSSIEELNFNELKKCEKNQAKKYIVVSLADDVVKKQNAVLENKDFSEWHTKTPEVSFLTLNINTNFAFYKGKMLKIFHKEYKPATNLNS